MTNPHDPQVPPYGSPEYEQWYRANVNPDWPLPRGPMPPKRKHHLLAWCLGVIALLVIGGISGGLVTSTRSGTKAADRNLAATTPATTQVPCVNSANLCPASDPTDHNVGNGNGNGNTEPYQVPTDAPTTDAALFPTTDPDLSTVTATPIGGTITITQPAYDGIDATIDVTLNSVESYDYAAYPYTVEFPSRHGRFAILDVTVEVIKGTYDYDAWDFTWQAADGTTYFATSGNGLRNGYTPYLSSGTLHTGQVKRGNVGLDVPRARGAQVIMWSDDLDDASVIGRWK